MDNKLSRQETEEIIEYLVGRGACPNSLMYLDLIDESGHIIFLIQEAYNKDVLPIQRITDIASWVEYMIEEFGRTNIDFSKVNLRKLPLGVGHLFIDEIEYIYPNIDKKTADALSDYFEWYWNAEDNLINDCFSATTVPFEYPNYSIVMEHRGAFLALNNIDSKIAEKLLKEHEFVHYCEAMDQLRRVETNRVMEYEISLAEICKKAGIQHYPVKWQLKSKEALVNHIERNDYKNKNNRFACSFNDALVERKEEEIVPLLSEEIGLSADEMDMALDLLYENNKVEDIVKAVKYGLLYEAYQLLDSSTPNLAAQSVNVKFENK